MSKCEVENSHVWVCIPIIIIISSCISGSEMLSSGSAVVSHFHRGHKRQWGLHVKITAGQRAIFNRGAHTAKQLRCPNTISAIGPQNVCGCHVLFPLHEKDNHRPHAAKRPWTHVSFPPWGPHTKTTMHGAHTPERLQGPWLFSQWGLHAMTAGLVWLNGHWDHAPR